MVAEEARLPSAFTEVWRLPLRVVSFQPVQFIELRTDCAHTVNTLFDRQLQKYRLECQPSRIFRSRVERKLEIWLLLDCANATVLSRMSGCFSRSFPVSPV
jgi:hypothetical protein